MNRRFCLVERGVGRFLPSLRRDPLPKISLRVHESHSNQGHTEIAGFLAMVSGENAQTAAINGNGGMQTKFCREVGDGGSFQIACAFLTNSSVGKVLIEQVDTSIAAYTRDLRQGASRSGLTLARSLTGLWWVRNHRGRIDVFEQPTGFRSPTPPKILRQFRQTTEVLRERTIHHSRRIHKHSFGQDHAIGIGNDGRSPVEIRHALPYAMRPSLWRMPRRHTVRQGFLRPG